MAKKGTIGIIAGVVGVSAIIGIFSPKKAVESINLSIPNSQIEYDINTEIPIEISVFPKGVDTSTLEYISDEGITFTDSQIITGNMEGTYYFYVTSGDIQSNVLSIKVVDIIAREEAVARWLEKEQAAKEAEEQRLAEEQAAKEAEAQRLAEEQAAREAEAQRLAEEQAAKEAEAQRLAEEQAAKEAEAQRQAEEQAVGQAVQNAQTSEQIEESSGTQNNNSDSSGDASNFNTYDNSSQQQTEATYVLNTHTMKIHHPSCSSVKKIAPQNYATSNSSLDDLISQGYSTCGNCFK
ncbi:MAG: hypothetical protein K2I22_04835 [Lachnospiraceae bacterium]|nr:hypothetical protein [Lachnospiraceae bacterium]